MYIRFKTDSSVSNRGFEAAYDSALEGEADIHFKHSDCPGKKPHSDIITSKPLTNIVLLPGGLSKDRLIWGSYTYCSKQVVKELFFSVQTCPPFSSTSIWRNTSASIYL